MSERRAITWVDWVAIGLFAVGAYGTLLMLLALGSTAPLEMREFSGLVASKWKFAFGIFPSLFWNAAIALIGAQLFLQGSKRNLVRNLVGVTGLALAFTVVFGALKNDAGGIIGERTGAVVTSLTHIAVGVFTGIVAAFAVVWFAWLRNSGPSSATSSASTSGSLTPASSTPVAKPAAKGGAARSTARAQPFKSNTSVEGVTAAESAALFPDEDLLGDEARVQKLNAEKIAAQKIATEKANRVDPVARKTTPAVVPPPVAPNSPYPEDVRRKGQVPPGAKPLESSNATDERPSDLPAPTVYRWTAPRVESQPEVGAGADLAPAMDDAAIDAGFDDVEEDEFDEVEHEEGFDLTVEGSIEETATDSVTSPYVAPVATVPTPSWEQPALFVPQEGDEEPVDAYGTPMTLVEKLRQSRRDSGIEERAVESAPTAAAPRAEVVTPEAIDDEELSDEEHEIEPIVAVVVEEELDTDEEIDEESDEESDEDEFYDEEEEALVEEEAAADEDEDFDEEFDEDEDLADLEDEADEESEVEVIVAEIEEPIVSAPAAAASVAPAASIETPPIETAPIQNVASGPASKVSAPIEASPAPLKSAAASLVPRELDAEPEVEAPSPKVAAAKTQPATEATKAPISAESNESRPAAKVDPAARADVAQPSLFDAVEKPSKKVAAAERAEKAEKSAKTEKAEPTEKDVVLQPQAAVPPERATKSVGAVDARTKLLTEIGCLFIEKGRVAVSMLQRQYTMEFDDACKVLDDLQEMGLIGPYLGGQRRDILLTREQWLETVSKAAATR